MMKTRSAAPMLILAIVSVATIALSCFVGPAEISPVEALRAFFDDGPAGVIVREIRLPRALAAFVAGATLGASGAALQGLLRNPLADPGVLGVSSMAALGAVVAIYFNLSSAAPSATPIAAVAFALIATALLQAVGAGRLSPGRLILVGVGLSSFAGALIALVMNLAPNPFILSDLVNWLFGSVANRSFADLGLLAPFMAAGLAFALLSAPGLSALTIGEEAAASIGADVSRTRLFAIVGAALMTGAAVALAGAIGFVGIVAPHVARPFVGHDPGRAILPAAMIGGATLALADLCLRLLPFDQEMKLGVAAALIGAPAFILVAARTQRIAR
jgi:iron complex transport system permease protein